MEEHPDSWSNDSPKKRETEWNGAGNCSSDETLRGAPGWDRAFGAIAVVRIEFDARGDWNADKRYTTRQEEPELTDLRMAEDPAGHQLGDGRWTLSITSTSVEMVRLVSRRPSCSLTAMKMDG